MARKKVEIAKTEKTPVEEPKKYTQEQYEKKVIELAKTGLTSEKIGENIRKEGMHPQEFKGKISEILKKEKLYINPDLKNIQEKLERINTHSEKNIQDKRAKREKDRFVSHIRRLKIYHKA